MTLLLPISPLDRKRHLGPSGLALAAILTLAARPAAADLALAAVDLLAAPETALGGAITACVVAVADPANADMAFDAAGWQPFEDYDGTNAWEQGDTWVTYWTEPGFCMVANETISTEAMEATLLGLTDAPPPIGRDADGCATYDLGPVTATLTSSGNDPVCTSDSGAALRFQLPE